MMHPDLQALGESLRPRSILVVFDSSSRSQETMEQAIALAEQHGSRLTAIGVESASVVAAMNCGTPWSSFEPQVMVGEILRRELDSAVHQVPAEIPVTRIYSRGPMLSSVRHSVELRAHDLVLVDGRRMAWMRRRLSVPLHVVGARRRKQRRPGWIGKTAAKAA